MAIYVNTYALNEGKQAEVYKRKKFYDKDIEDKDRQDRRFKDSGAGFGFDHRRSSSDNTDFALNNPQHHKLNSYISDKEKAQAVKNDKRHKEAISKVLDAYEKTKTDKASLNNAVDATDRHMRRHPEAYKEMGIFAECYFINE